MSPKSIDAVITRVLFSKVSQWSQTGVPFLIALTNQGTIKGNMYEPSCGPEGDRRVGQRYRLWGEWKNDPKRGQDFFEFYSYEILVERSADGVADYLSRYLAGFGPARARKAVELWGEDAADVLRADPSRALEVPGVTPDHVAAIAEHFEQSKGIDPAAYAGVYSLLSEYHPPKRVVEHILHDFGSAAPEVITENPYLLTSYKGIGWDTADNFAINKVKYDKRGILRYRAVVMECLARTAAEGNTVIDRTTLLGMVQGLVGVGGPFDEAIDLLADEELIEVDGKLIAEISLASAEREIAYRISGLIQSHDGTAPDFPTEGLEGEQVQASEVIAANPVCVLTGPPGTGKTFTITNMVRSLHKRHHMISMVAPTGKAAKRAGEVLEKWIPNSGIECSTIHRALGSIGNGAGIGVPDDHAKFGRGRRSMDFVHGENQYLELDTGIGDEWSMVDVSLFAAYLRAIPPGSRVTLCGDENQLPSVGPGAVLRDIIAAGLPTARLTQPRRNSGRIVQACHAIKDGRPPRPTPFDPSKGENWLHIEIDDPAEIAAEIVSLHADTDRDPLWDLQVISPQNGGLPIACDNLNRLLSRHFNPDNHTDDDDGTGEKYAVGDKVVRTQNGFVPEMVPGLSGDKTFVWGDTAYGLRMRSVVNGDIGQVVGFAEHHSNRYVIVDFKNPSRLCRLTLGDANISLAYAITVHKAQGSGFPVVIAPVHGTFHWNTRTGTGLWCRELAYTIFSRAEEVLITVGRLSSVDTAVGRKTIHRRQTRLTKFLKEALENVKNARAQSGEW